jgi:hypothetical protein
VILKIAILTRSNKRRNNGEYGCCVAGITENGEWIRLVADRDGDSLPQDNSTPITKTVIDAKVAPTPLAYQPENAILDSWKLLSESTKAYVGKLAPTSEPFLFGNNSNRLSNDEIRQTNGSLRLIEVKDIIVYDGKKCRFTHNGNQYEDISMTDPNCYAQEGTVRSFGNATIVVSLPNSSPYIKFVAAIYSHT